MSNNINTFSDEQLQTNNNIVQNAVATTTKGRLLTFKQGAKADLPNLKVGEPAFCTDDFSFYLGSDDGNKRVVMEHELGSISVEDGAISFAKLDTSLQNQINDFITLNDIPVVSLYKKWINDPQMLDQLNNAGQGNSDINVVDNLTSISATDALSARQGKVLNDKIDNISINGVPANLTPATSTTLGGIKVRTNLSVTSDGTLSVGNATTSAIGAVRLNDTVISTSNTQAATANAVKKAYDKAVEAMSGGTIANICQDGVTTSDSGTAFGFLTKATSVFSYAEGYATLSDGYSSHAEGYGTIASGNTSHAEGGDTVANGSYAHAEGFGTMANVFASHAGGHYNKFINGNLEEFNITSDAVVVGNGTSDTSRSNAFRVKFNGSVYGLSAFNSSGADYAEYFEWKDSNPNNEDRVGYFVTLNGNKIEIANSKSEYIIGVISATPSVIGDSHQDQWQDMYIKDEWGRIQNEYVEVQYDEIDKDGKVVTKTRKDYVHKLNPNYNPEFEYIGREDRQEWDAVGMLGKLLVRDNGSCEVNGYAKVSDDGIATKSDSGYRVIKRVNENIVQIIFK